MIPVDFEYVMALTLSGAVQHYAGFATDGKQPMYYGGGTEIITFARSRHLHPDAVIDIKQIPETQVTSVQEGKLILGSGVTLSQITDSPLMDSEFPLLRATVNDIADKTARNKITLGGNICGKIMYREAILPFLVSDSLVRTFGANGGWERSIHQVFQRDVQLKPGALFVQLITDRETRTAPFVHIKRRKAGQVGYPIVSAAAIRLHGRIRIALSGVYPFPFRSFALETALQREGVDRRQRLDEAIQVISPALILDNYEASRAYRTFILRTVLEEILQHLGGE